MAIIDKPSDYLFAKLYTGTGSSNAITGVGFAPNWVWIKSRSDAHDHFLTDTVRGATKNLNTVNTDAEATIAQGLKSFDSDGFTVGTNGNVNENTETFVAWNWLGGTSFTNDASATGIGSIDSTGNFNNNSGFSIVSWTGTGANGTIKHGLNSTPKFMIFKNRQNAVDNWVVYSIAFPTPQTSYMYLNTTMDIRTGVAEFFNSTNPTSSVLSVGSHDATNKNGDAIIAYCFSEKQGFSKFGSYTGNGNADGTFVYTSFKPAFVMIKVSSTTSNWGMFDNKRLGYNVKNEFVRANEQTAESSDYDGIDFLSNGFKLRTTSTLVNAAQTYLYFAFAENPFVTSTANGSIPATAR